MLQDCQDLESYIKDELNVMEIKTESQEDKFIKYNCEPDNKLIGGALKKAYNKDFKKAIQAISSDALKGYLNGDQLEVKGVNIEKDWLRVEKKFDDKNFDSKKYATVSSGVSSVMLCTAIDDELKLMGVSREITNRIQKLRKAANVQPEDPIVVYYELN